MHLSSQKEGPHCRRFFFRRLYLAKEKISFQKTANVLYTFERAGAQRVWFSARKLAQICTANLPCAKSDRKIYRKFKKYKLFMADLYRPFFEYFL